MSERSFKALLALAGASSFEWLIGTGFWFLFGWLILDAIMYWNSDE